MFEPQRGLGLGTGEHLVGGNVPIPDHVAGARQRQRPAFDVRHDAARHAAGEGVLHYREADQHDDQHQPAKQRRADDVVGHQTKHGERCADHPNHKKKPGRDQHHRAIVVVAGKIYDQRKAEHGDQKERHPRDAGSDRRREQRYRD